MLHYPIDSETIRQLRELSENISLKVKVLNSLSEEERHTIHRWARVSTIGASTRIENAILTDAEVLWMDTELTQESRTTAFRKKQNQIKNKLSKDRERSIEEVAGCRSMLFLIYEQWQDLWPLTQSHLRGLHQQMLQFYPPARPYLGKYKTITNSVIERNHASGQERIVLKTADPGPVTEAAMSELLNWYPKSLSEDPWSLAVACEFVFRFLAIHPFQDGNGRLGRALFLLALLQSPDQNLAKLIRYLALDRQIEKNKEEYYLVLQRCSQGKFRQDPRKYKIEHFLKYMLKMFRLSLQDIEVYRSYYASLNKLSPAASQVFECFRDHPERRLQTKNLLELTGLPRRTVVQSLNTLLKYSLLQKWGQGPAVRYQIVF